MSDVILLIVDIRHPVGRGGLHQMETQSKVIVYLFVYLMHFILKAGFVRESLEWEQRALSRQQDFYTAITTCRCTLADDKKRQKIRKLSHAALASNAYCHFTHFLDVKLSFLSCTKTVCWLFEKKINDRILYVNKFDPSFVSSVYQKFHWNILSASH